MPHAERTLVKPILWLLGLTSVAGVADGAYQLAAGNHSWLVIMAIAWCTVNSVWMWWILSYLEVYERKQAIAGLDGVGGAGQIPPDHGAVRAAACHRPPTPPS